MPTETLLLELWAGQPRPEPHHPVITKETVERLLKPVMGWLQQGDWTGPEDDIRKELTRLIEGRGFLDGYAMAKSLDSWDPNAELVEILDDASIMRSAVRSKTVQAWVNENQETIVPLIEKFPEGTRVSWLSRQEDPRGVLTYGVVKSIWANEAQAVVVADGPPNKNGCPVIDIEKLSLA
jgi:hypothetical protein